VFIRFVVSVCVVCFFRFVACCLLLCVAMFSFPSQLRAHSSSHRDQLFFIMSQKQEPLLEVRLQVQTDSTEGTWTDYVQLCAQGKFKELQAMLDPGQPLPGKTGIFDAIADLSALSVAIVETSDTGFGDFGSCSLAHTLTLLNYDLLVEDGAVAADPETIKYGLKSVSKAAKADVPDTDMLGRFRKQHAAMILPDGGVVELSSDIKRLQASRAKAENMNASYLDLVSKAPNFSMVKSAEVLASRVKCFPLIANSQATVLQVFRGIAARGGNPEVIVLFGHGSSEVFKTPDNASVSGSQLARDLRTSGLQPKAVIFVSCKGFGVAKAAHAAWLSDMPDGSSYAPVWMGARKKLPAATISVALSVIPRFLRLVLAVRTAKDAGLERLRYFFLHECTKMAWSSGNLKLGGPTPHRMWQLFLAVCVDTPVKKTPDWWYFCGEDTNQATAMAERTAMMRNPRHVRWQNFVRLATDWPCNDAARDPEAEVAVVTAQAQQPEEE